MIIVDGVTLGPFEFTFLPDGDDPGTGAVLLSTESSYRATTAFGVARDEWDAFVAAASGRKRVIKSPVAGHAS